MLATSFLPRLLKRQIIARSWKIWERLGWWIYAFLMGQCQVVYVGNAIFVLTLVYSSIPCSFLFLYVDDTHIEREYGDSTGCLQEDVDSVYELPPTTWLSTWLSLRWSAAEVTSSWRMQSPTSQQVTPTEENGRLEDHVVLISNNGSFSNHAQALEARASALSWWI